MPNLNMNNFQTRNRTFDPDPLPYISLCANAIYIYATLDPRLLTHT